MHAAVDMPRSHADFARWPTVFAPGTLAGRRVMVSGGGSGMGRATAWLAARLGAQVIVAGRTEAKLADVAEAIVAAGHQADIQVLDIRSRESVDEAFAAIRARAGVIDLLVNSAGGQFPQASIDYSEKGWQAVVNTNLNGTWHMMHVAAQHWREAGKGGAIVNIGSGCNKLAFPKLVDYTASKGGIEQFTKAAAVDLGPHGIRVNCVAPGAIATERTLGEAGDYVATWSRLTPLRRIGTPSDVAAVVLFMASPAAAFVTGQTIGVDGGLFTQAVWPYSQGSTS